MCASLRVCSVLSLRRCIIIDDEPTFSPRPLKCCHLGGTASCFITLRILIRYNHKRAPLRIFCYSTKAIPRCDVYGPHWKILYFPTKWVRHPYKSISNKHFHQHEHYLLIILKLYVLEKRILLSQSDLPTVIKMLNFKLINNLVCILAYRKNPYQVFCNYESITYSIKFFHTQNWS